MSKQISFTVSANHRYLEADGKPFFYLADTAWNLFHRLTLEEAKWYLDKRKKQGFTAIQAVIIAEQEGLSTPNEQGDFIFEDRNPLKPNDAYFNHIEEVVSYANNLGLTMVLLPSWGSYLTTWGWNGPDFGNEDDVVITPETGTQYGKYLAQKFSKYNIIWMIGGDRQAKYILKASRAIVDGIKSIDSDHLMTFHPMGLPNDGGASSTVMHLEKWLDFNALQSGHQWGESNYNLILADRAKDPIKPTFDSEPRYENHHDNFDTNARKMNAWQSRQAAYWALIAGACGHTYGCHEIWQFYSDKHPAITGANLPWKEATDLGGAKSMRYVAKFAKDYKWYSFIPKPQLVIEGQEYNDGHVQTCINEDNAIIGYVPTSKTVTIDCKDLSNASKLIWFDPTNGTTKNVELSNLKDSVTITTPGKNSVGDEDFVFIIS